MINLESKVSILSIEDVIQKIESGSRLLLAGSEKVLSKLPKGNWIAGSTPYFMSDGGGVLTHDQILVTELPLAVEDIKIKTYDQNSLDQISQNYFENGFSFIVIPAFSDTHQYFAKNVTHWNGLFNQPLIGWVSGSDLNNLIERPQVYNGTNSEAYFDSAVVMHIKLNKDYLAKPNIINLFKQGYGDVITFSESKFEVSTCYVNGQSWNLYNYIISQNANTQLPLVANYMGAMVNVSIREIDHKNKTVSFFAPVYPQVEYKFAEPLQNDYKIEFQKALNEHNVNPIFSCNCILNYMYAHLEGKKAGNLISPITFGEIAYMLLNQTLVYLTLEKVK